MSPGSWPRVGVWHLFAPAEAKEELVAEKCYKRADYDLLAAMPAGRRAGHLQSRRLGPAATPPHRVLAGPYHRNVAGNLAALERLHGIARRGRGDHPRKRHRQWLRLCPANNETKFLAKRAPGGLLAGMVAGKIPDWLDIVPESNGKPLEIYRVVVSALSCEILTQGNQNRRTSSTLEHCNVTLS